MAGVVRVAGAGMMALLVAALFSTTAFAKEAASTSDARPYMASAQEVSAPVGANPGLVIVAVDEAGPAAKAGIVRGDILQMVGNVPVNSAAVLYGVVTASKVGDKVVLAVQHGDEARTITVPLGQMGTRPYLGVQVVDPPAVEAVQIPQTSEVAPEAAAPAVGAQIVTATVAENGDVVSVAPGLIVAEVMPGSPAAIAGLAAGDLILAIDGRPVASLDDLVNALKGHTPGEVVTVRVAKGGPVGANFVDIPVTLGTAPDDPARAYLGLSLVTMAPGVTAALPSTDAFTAPALPVIPAMPVGPDVIYSYSDAGSYVAPSIGQACGPTVQQYFYPPANGTFYIQGGTMQAVPLPPPMPAAPFFIYRSGVNPELYPDAASGEVQRKVVVYAAPVSQPYQGSTVDVTTSSIPTQKQVTIMRSQAGPVWTVAIPGMAPGQEVTTIAGSAEAVRGYWVQAIPEDRRFEVKVIGSTEDSAGVVSKSIVQVAPTARSFTVIGGDPAGVAVPQAVPQAMPVPAETSGTGDGWY